MFYGCVLKWFLMENASYAKVRLESAPYSTKFGIGKCLCNTILKRSTP